MIVDFIDMAREHHREQVLAEFRKQLARDRVKTSAGGFSPLGLVEMTRKRTRESLAHMLCEPCVACGGQETYSELLSPRPATDKPGRCWPGGHAATGFTLFALFFMFRDRKPRLAKAGLILAFTLGSIFSVGRMLQGAHFLSHNLWTAVFCWLICLGVYYFVLYRPERREPAVQLSR